MSPAGDHRDRGIVHDVVTDAAQERPLQLAQPPRASHDHGGALFVGGLHDGLPWLALALTDLPFNLKF